MGYLTEFAGQFRVAPSLAPAHAAYLRRFSATRRMQRNDAVVARLPDPIREAAGLPVGREGAYFVGGAGPYGEERDPSVLEPETHPSEQPGFWCGWRPTEDGRGFEWDGQPKFYEYVPWLRYLIAHFLAPWGYAMSGTVHWSGEADDDVGFIDVRDNVVSTRVDPEMDAFISFGRWIREVTYL